MHKKYLIGFSFSFLFGLFLQATSSIRETFESDEKVFIKFQNFHVSMLEWRDEIDSLKSRGIKNIRLQLEPYFQEQSNTAEASINNLNVVYITELLSRYNEIKELDLTSNYVTFQDASTMLAEALKANSYIHTLRLKNMALGTWVGDDDCKTYPAIAKIIPTMKNLRILDLRGNRYDARELRKIRKEIDVYNITLLYDDNDF